MKRIIDKVSRVIVLTAVYFLPLVCHAYGVDIYVEQDGIVYHLREYYGGFKEYAACIADILDEAGTDIHFPDYIRYEGVDYSVMDWEWKWGYPEWWIGKRYGFPPYAYLEFSNKKIRSMRLSKSMPFPDGYDRSPNVPFEDILAYNMPGLEEITVDPASERYATYEGGLYISSADNQYENLRFVPRVHNDNGTVKIHPSAKKISVISIGSNKNIKYLVIPKSVKEVFLSNSLYLEKIIFEGNYQYGGYGIQNNPNLREISWKGLETGSIVSSGRDFVFLGQPNLVKLSSYKGVKYVSGDVEKDTRIMLYDFPDVVETSYYVTLGKQQAVIFGKKENRERSDFDINFEWLDNLHPVTLCVNVLTPPHITYGTILDSDWPDYKIDDWYKEVGTPRNWTVYVPAESVSAYENDRYWGAMGKYYPITDKLIPLVSEPELEIKPGMTHEYLWDVMPLGEAVAAERGEWTSDDPSVATVDEDGVLTAVSLGEATITFTLADTEGNLYTAESKVSVVKELSGVEEIEAESVAVAPETSVPDGVYDLHGRRVGDTLDGLAPGLYIVRHQCKTEKRLVR